MNIVYVMWAHCARRGSLVEQELLTIPEHFVTKSTNGVFNVNERWTRQTWHPQCPAVRLFKKQKQKQKQKTQENKQNSKMNVMSYHLKKNSSVLLITYLIQGLLKKNEKKQARSFIFRSLNKFGDFDLSHLSHWTWNKGYHR